MVTRQEVSDAIRSAMRDKGIMSAINFRADVERIPDPGGDRVRITLDGKFLPYQWG